MSDHKQLPMRYDDESAATELWDYVLPALREAVDQLRLAQVAGQLNVTASQLAHALAGRDRKYVRAEWLLWVLANAPSPDLLRRVADLRNHDIVEREPADAAELLAARMEAEEELLGRDVRALLEAKARAKLAQRRAR